MRDALVRRGMDPGRAEAAAHGMTPVTMVVDEVTDSYRELLSTVSRRHGIQCVSGDGWALLAGAVAQIGGLTRPGVSPLSADLAVALGTPLAARSADPPAWVTARGTLSLDRPVVAGILNVTPDSFSDGGAFLDPEPALRHADALVEAGADLIDIGAESTRPGTPAPVPIDVEWQRLAPVLTELTRRHPALPVSVDTVKSEIARRALDAGAWIINDVSGLRLDPEIAGVCAGAGAGLVLMHSRGSVSDMASYEHASYGDVVDDVREELGGAVAVATERGVRTETLVVDPGLGFSKRPGDNYRLLNRLETLADLGRPVLVGPSRKRFLGAGAPDWDVATAACCVAAYLRGASLFRVHAVAETRRALEIAHAVRSA